MPGWQNVTQRGSTAKRHRDFKRRHKDKKIMLDSKKGEKEGENRENRMKMDDRKEQWGKC